MDQKGEDWNQLDISWSEFVAVMSHEIRTPLTAIQGYTDILLSETYGTLSTQQAQYLISIRQSTQDLMDMFIQYVNNHTYDKSELEFRSDLESIERKIKFFLDGKVGSLEEKQIKCLVGARDYVQKLHKNFEYLLDKYESKSD